MKEEEPVSPRREMPITPPTTDADEDRERESAMLNPAEAEARRLGKRPSLEHLEAGTIADGDGTVYPLFEPGQRIVAERCSSILSNHPWLDTRVYRVNRIDDDTGVAQHNRIFTPCGT